MDFFFVCIWRLLETKAGIEGLAFLRKGLENKVMKVGSETFGNPYFQMVLQNQQFSPIIGRHLWVLCKEFWCCQKVSNSDFQSQFSMSDFFFNWNYWFNSTFFVTLAA